MLSKLISSLVLGSFLLMFIKTLNDSRSVIAKLGTTQNQSDGWFMGITPNLVTGVWTGCDDRSVHFRDILYGQGANMALPVFAEYMQRVYADTLIENMQPIPFDIPRSIDVKLECDESTISIEEEF